ncbi:phosphatidate cytidylyltransferase [Colwellia asteriadis]|uniref:Phosphatidate cytidylyltransferase n=1 Tax=Colwellia asteriadis TaxID=517723 RepID=A0ABN1L635_9GAMM
MLKQRIITALILAPAAILAIFYLPLVYFSGLLLGVVAIGAWEWAPFVGLKKSQARVTYTAITVMLIALLWYLLPIEQLWSPLNGLHQYAQFILWASVAWWAIAAFLMLTYPKTTAFWEKNRIIIGLFGWFTLIPTWLAFVVLRSHDYHIANFHGAQLLMCLFVLVWCADIGAYFVGKSIGKRKLMPNVSPGKTLEGFLGGVVCAAIVVAVSAFVLDWSQKQLLSALLITLLITTVSVLGDLTESMFKRQSGIKDSGTILPGHGGILDRIDSLTATAPVFALCYVFLGW